MPPYIGIDKVYKVTSYLEHYGVLGMKWGVRKEKPKAKNMVRTSVHGMLGDKDSNVSKTAVKTNQKTTNPYYIVNDYYKTNCAYCTMAFNLRLRGYSVEAMPSIYGGLNAEEIVKCFTNINTGKPPSISYSGDLFNSFNNKKERSKILDKYNISDDYFGYFTNECSKKDRIGISNYISDTCKTYGEGSNGYIGVNWSEGSAHAMAWVVENGEFKVIDAQTGDIYNEEDLADLLEYVTSFRIARLDDCEPNANVLKYVRSSDKNIHNVDGYDFIFTELPEGGTMGKAQYFKKDKNGSKITIDIPNERDHKLFKRGDS